MKLYREVKASERLPNKKGPYYVKVKKPHEAAAIFEQHDIYMWLAGPELQQAELWVESFESWLEPIEITEEGIEEIFSAVWYTDLDGVTGLEEAITELLSKLKGE